jgi:carbamoyl-phosphate synthase large subunit
VKKILITGSGGSAGLGFTRCLKIAPEKIFTVGTDCNEKSIFNSETDKRILIPPAKSSNYIKVINEIIDNYNIEFIHAQPDIEIKVLSENVKKIKCLTFLPSMKTVEICQDKMRTQKILEENEIPVARAILIKSPDDLKEAFEEIKPPIWIRAIKGAGGKGSLLVRKFEHANSWIDYWDGWGNFMACEYLPGSNFGCDLIFNNGEFVTCQTKERLEYILSQASPSGITGTSGVVKAVNRKDIEKISKDAIYSIDSSPNGVFSVDLKENRNKKACVTEINPGRFLTSSLHFFYMTRNLLPYVYVKIAYKEYVPEKLLSKRIFEGTILVRSLDKYPILLKESKLKKIKKKMMVSDYVSIS